MKLETAGARFAMFKLADIGDNISYGLNAASFVPGIGNIVMPVAGAYDAVNAAKEGDLIGTGTSLAGGAVGLALAGEGGQIKDKEFRNALHYNKFQGVKKPGALGRVGELIDRGDEQAARIARPILGGAARGLNRVSPTASRGFVRGMRWAGRNPIKSFLAVQIPSMIYEAAKGQAPELSAKTAELEKEAALPLAALAGAALTAYGLYGGASDMYEGVRTGSAGQALWGAAQIPLSLIGGGAAKGIWQGGKALAKVPALAGLGRGAQRAGAFGRVMGQRAPGMAQAAIGKFSPTAGKAVGGLMRFAGKHPNLAYIGAALGAGALGLTGGEGGESAEDLAGHQQNPNIGIQPNLGNVQNVAPGIDLMRQTQAQNAGAKEPPMPFQQQQQKPQLWGQQPQQDQE